jgi:hypothetical protein
MASGKGVKRRYVQKERISLDGLPRTCGSFFLDSGAHSLYNEHVLGKPEKKRYTYYIKENGLLTKEFREYLDKYAKVWPWSRLLRYRGRNLQPRD